MFRWTDPFISILYQNNNDRSYSFRLIIIIIIIGNRCVPKHSKKR